MIDFRGFPKIVRLFREMVITEKIDGTNASVTITEDGQFLPGCRTRFITPEADNQGFAKWCMENKEELLKLGIGQHYGEWWGQGIQRNYGLKEKRFSLFNIDRWSNETVRPKCCSVVPTLYRLSYFDTSKIRQVLDALKIGGSIAAPGFMKPEGVVIYHTTCKQMFKVTIENDEYHKGELNAT